MINYFNRISSLLIISFFLALPFFNNSYISYGTYAIKEIYICLAALLAVFLWLPGYLRRPPGEINPYVPLCFIFLLFLLLSGTGNPEINRALYMERVVIWLCIIFISAASAMPAFEKIAKAALLSNLAVTAAAVLQGINFIAGGGLHFPGENDFDYRIFSVFGNPDLYAAYLVAVIPLVYSVYDNSKKKSILALVVLNVVLLLLTRSAAGIGTLSLLALIWAFKSFKGKFRYAAAAIALLIMASAAWLILAQKKDSAVMRIFLWDSSLRMTADYPVFGAGAGNFRIFTPAYQSTALKEGKYPAYVAVHDEAYAHNDVMQFVSETGIAGGAAFIVFILFPFVVYFRNKNRKPGDAYMIFSMAGTVIFSMANFPFEMPLIAVIYVILAFKISASARPAGLKPGALVKTGQGIVALSVAVSVVTFVPDYLERGYLVSYMGYAVTKEMKVDFAANSEKAWKDYQLSFYRGIMKSREGDYRNAIMNFSRAIELFPGFAGAIYNLGNAYYNSGEMEKASESYKKLIALNPAFVPAYNNLALIEKRKGNYTEAIRLLLEAEKFNPALLELNYNLADSYYLAGNMEKSREYTIKSLKIKADYEPALMLAGKLGIKP